MEKQFSHLDEAVAALKRIKANLKRYKASVLKAAVEGKLTEEWRKEHPCVETASELLRRILAERRRKWEVAELEKMRAKGKEPKEDEWKKKYKEPNGADTSKLPKLPKEWIWVRLDSVADIKGGITKDSKRKVKKAKRLPYLRVANVQRGYLNLEEMKTPRRRDGGVSLGKKIIILIIPQTPFTKGGSRKPHSRDCGVLKT